MSSKKETKAGTTNISNKIVLFSVLGFVLGILVAIIFVFADYQHYLRSCDNDPCSNDPKVMCIQACQHRSILFGKDRPFDPTTKFYYF